MHSIGELPSGSTNLSPKLEKTDMDSEDEDEDEFHDACDRVAPEGEGVEFTEEEILVSPSVNPLITNIIKTRIGSPFQSRVIQISREQAIHRGPMGRSKGTLQAWPDVRT
jgi:hypothetical protein